MYLSFTACREVLKRLTWERCPGADGRLGQQPVPAAGSECQGDTSGRPDDSDVGLSHGYVEGHESPQPCGFSLSPFAVFLVLLRAEGTRLLRLLVVLGFPRARGSSSSCSLFFLPRVRAQSTAMGAPSFRLSIPLMWSPSPFCAQCHVSSSVSLGSCLT